MSKAPHLAVIRSAYRPEIVGKLYEGAIIAMKTKNATHDVFEVNGSLEIPAAVSILKSKKFDGYVVLGCILKGDTIHDEVIAYTAFAALDEMARHEKLAIGNGILTVNTVAQAEERADHTRQNRGGEAALAALKIIELKKQAA